MRRILLALCVLSAPLAAQDPGELSLYTAGTRMRDTNLNSRSFGGSLGLMESPGSLFNLNAGFDVVDGANSGWAALGLILIKRGPVVLDAHVDVSRSGVWDTGRSVNLVVSHHDYYLGEMLSLGRTGGEALYGLSTYCGVSLQSHLSLEIQVASIRRSGMDLAWVLGYSL